MSKAKSYNLGDETSSLLQDFCEAHYGAPEVRIIREAVRSFVDQSLCAEPELKKRFEAARRQRLGVNVHPIRISQ